MNRENIRMIKKGSKIYVTNMSSRPEKIYFEMSVKTPFGIEESNNLKYVNWELTDEMKELLLVVEQSLCQQATSEYNQINSWTMKSSIRGKEEFTKLLRTKTDEFVEKNKEYNVRITLDSIWLHNATQTYGLLWISSLC